MKPRKNNTPLGWSIVVDEDDVNDSLELIEGKRILSSKFRKAKKESIGILSSREEKNQALREQLAEGLANTLERLPGVLEARVHLNLAHKSDFSIVKAEYEESASVLIVTAGAVRDF